MNQAVAEGGDKSDPLQSPAGRTFAPNAETPPIVAGNDPVLENLVTAVRAAGAAHQAALAALAAYLDRSPCSTAPEPERLIPMKEKAFRLGISYAAAWKRAKRNKLPTKLINGKLMARE